MTTIANGTHDVDVPHADAPTFAPGVRLSSADVIVLLFGAVAATALALLTWWWGFVVAFVVGHFFLFCNVFRIGRTSELLWALVFVLLVAGTIAADSPGWAITVAVSLSLTAVLVLIEMRKPSYHGIGWQRINPELPAWWQARETK